jgi:hypothetical protein
MRKSLLTAAGAAALSVVVVMAMTDVASAKGPGGTGWSGSSPPGLSRMNKTPPGFSEARETPGWNRGGCRINGKLVPPGWCR